MPYHAKTPDPIGPLQGWVGLMPTPSLPGDRPVARITADLRRRLLAGDWSDPTHPLPSISELSREFGGPQLRHSVWRSLKKLEAEGLVENRRGYYFRVSDDERNGDGSEQSG